MDTDFTSVEVLDRNHSEKPNESRKLLWHPGYTELLTRRVRATHSATKALSLKDSEALEAMWCCRSLMFFLMLDDDETGRREATTVNIIGLYH